PAPSPGPARFRSRWGSVAGVVQRWPCRTSPNTRRTPTRPPPVQPGRWHSSETHPIASVALSSLSHRLSGPALRTDSAGSTLRLEQFVCRELATPTSFAPDVTRETRETPSTSPPFVGLRSPCRPHLEQKKGQAYCLVCNRHILESDVTAPISKDSFGARDNLTVGDTSYEVFRLDQVEGAARLPYSLKILLENLLRTEDGTNITAEHIRALGNWDPSSEPDTEIQFTPARVVSPDSTGGPCASDLASMREAVADLRGAPEQVNPQAPAEMVIDHSVVIDAFGNAGAFERNMEIEYERNKERYQFLRWGQGAFDEFKVVPPGTGIVHQVNIEHLARSIMARNGQAYPDTCVGTDSHTTMVNGLGVLGWG